MRTIVCPVDFSSTSENAAQYAVELSLRLDAEVVICHAQHIPVLDAHTPAVAVQDLMEQQQLEVSKKLDAVAARLKSQFGGKVRTWQTFGLVVDMIKEIESESTIYLVVMGTKGATNALDKFIGTTSTDVMTRVELPMIIVPEGCQATAMDHVGYATDFTQETDDGILDFQEFIRPFGGDLSIVHVSNRKVDADEILAVVRHFESSAEVETIVGENVTFELNEYVENNNIKLLALKRHKRNFFESLFHKSISKEMAITSKIPVLIF